jgi:hypothetical protein
MSHLRGGALLALDSRVVVLDEILRFERDSVDAPFGGGSLANPI